ncbi:alpha/beta fold hydrolase [Robiginitomaculum antarcticum]|uniref:alpha/beta fold hydrolase n=1 Tax=Robiginitomaculum antarcticum TaxID=437507 RepID=UPI0003642130|nr:alpha/beta hydrolase [Robiginitomaculum antarcticum]
MSALKYLYSADGSKLAYKQSIGRNTPGYIWCGGLKSDMEGGKATTLHDWAARTDRPYLRFDYYGHGASEGHFREGTISRWTDDTLSVLDELTDGPQIIFGSSMGAWTALRTALARPKRVKALILISPAPDFTEKLMWARFSETIRAQIMEEGMYLEPSDYGEPYEITRELIVDGRANQMMDAPIDFSGPVRILQGNDDIPVPPAHSRKLVDLITSDDITYTVIKGGDHSLSRPDDLRRLIATAEEVEAVVSG